MPGQQDKARIRRIPGGPEEIAAAALVLFGVIALAVTVVAVTESYSNLYAFATDHGLHGWRAVIAPAAVDSFIIMGELVLFTSLLLGWDSALVFGAGCAMAAWGFLISVGGNVWHAPSASPVNRAVAGIWPVTATAALAVSLIIVKQLIADRKTPRPVPDPLTREPRRKRAARVPGPVAARDAEQRDYAVMAMARELASAGPPWPGEQKLGRDSGLGRRGAARALELARAMSNGNGDGSGNQS
jgi:hypothetical protein